MTFVSSSIWRATNLDNKEGFEMPISVLLFSFRGRINRQPYWLVALAIVVVMVLILSFGVLIGEENGFGAIILFAGVVYIPAIWIGLAVAAKRLHDRNKSAWWLLIFYALPGFLDVVGQEMIIFTFASLAISIWGLVELGFLRGTVGPNEYGPDPLANYPRRDGTSATLPEPQTSRSDGND